MGGWELQISSNKSLQMSRAKRVILATGLTSTPNMPKLEGEAHFQAPIFHTKDFYPQSHTLNTAKDVVILGGSKSAYDVVWAFSQAGAQTINMVIRPDGNGPVWMSPVLVTPFKLPLECLLHTRALSWFSPCPFGAEDGWGRIRDWLHGSWIGRATVNMFWKIIASDVTGLTGWDKHPTMAKLKPWNTTFWTGTALGILNYSSDIMELFRHGKVRVYIADVDHLSERQVHLGDGNVLAADVIVCATGWKNDSVLDKVHADGTSTLSSEDMGTLRVQADNKILDMYPRLRDQPTIGTLRSEQDAALLYRFMVPPNLVQRRNIAMAGQVSTLSNPGCTAVQALWISAFFDGKLDRIAQSDGEAIEEAMLLRQWSKWRYPCGYGASRPDLPFDCVPYHDLLLKDLGLQSQRKLGWLAKLFEPYGPSDYDGLLKEWLAKGSEEKKDA